MSRAFVITGLAVGLTALASLPTAAAGGAAAWTQQYPQSDGSPARSCASCHTADLTLTT